MKSLNSIGQAELMPWDTSKTNFWVFRLGLLSLFLLLFSFSLGVYMSWVEPYWIEVTTHRIQGSVNQPLKIAHLTDLHTNGMFRRERKVVELVRAYEPDLIVITGDNLNRFYDFYGVSKVLSEFRAPLGVWMVRGNWEKGVPLAKEVDELEKDEAAFYQKAGVRLLLNESARPRSDFWLVGFDDMVTSEKIIDSVANQAGSEYRIALFHSPGVFPKVASRVQLALAGHTHGGQVRLPVFGPIILPSGTGGFLEGWYSREGAKLYVSRGIGNTVVDVRLGARPEVTFLEIVPSK